MSTAKNVDVLIERAAARELSLRTVTDVLGIHPHLLRLHLLSPGGSFNGLAGQSVSVLIELARLIEAHPGDIVAGLDSVLDFPRLTGDPRAGEQAGPEVAVDALTVLAALAAGASGRRRRPRRAKPRRQRGGASPHRHDSLHRSPGVRAR